MLSYRSATSCASIDDAITRRANGRYQLEGIEQPKREEDDEVVEGEEDGTGGLFKGNSIGQVSGSAGVDGWCALIFVSASPSSLKSICISQSLMMCVIRRKTGGRGYVANLAGSMDVVAEEADVKRSNSAANNSNNMKSNTSVRTRHPIYDSTQVGSPHRPGCSRSDVLTIH